MSVFVNQGPWPWPPGRTQTGHTARRCRRRSFYDDAARRASAGPGPQGPAPALGRAEYLAQRLAQHI